MNFNDLTFLTIFLPIVLAGFYLLAGHAEERAWWIIAASLVFYGFSGLEHAIVLAITTLAVYALSAPKGIVGNRWRLLLAVGVPLTALIYYKYWTFLLADVFGLEHREVGILARAVDATLPAGISFFSFQMIAFAIDRYRNAIPEVPSFSRFALYITMFPQLVAGPILRYHDVSRSLRGLGTFRIDYDRASIAIGYVVYGLIAKVLIADGLKRYVDPLVVAPDALDPISAGYVIFAYSLQIYFDFYGYSLIAIGLGHLLGFEFPANFDRPYSALNPRDFWRRWHITLSFWIRDYAYRPLGGNEAYVRNILIIFVLCGLWHGAGFNFIAWGLYHALLVVGYHYNRAWWGRLPPLLQQIVTFVLVSLGWPLFLLDFHGTWQLLSSLVGYGTYQAPVALGLPQWTILLVAFAACYLVRVESYVFAVVPGRWRALTHTAAFSVLFVASLLLLDRSTSFIYFRF